MYGPCRTVQNSGKSVTLKMLVVYHVTATARLPVGLRTEEAYSRSSLAALQNHL